MISNIIIFSIIGIVIAVMVVVVLLYRKRATGTRIMKRISRKNIGKVDVNNDEESDISSESMEIIEKIVHETIPALRDDYMRQISTLSEKISNIETDISSLKASLNIEEKPKEEEIAVNIIGIKTEKGIELIFLSEDIKVPKKLIPNSEKVEENKQEEKKQVVDEELENKITEAIKNGNTTFQSIVQAVSESSNKVANVLARMIKSGKVVKGENKSYTIPQK
jgi:glutamyl/glutaminyl-tRNA synthetase